MNAPNGLRCVENCLTCHLRSESFFCALPKESLKVFDRIKHVTPFAARAVVFMEGEAPRGIFMLCQGQVKLSTTSRDGKTFLLRLAKAGDVLGLHATVTGKPHEVTVETPLSPRRSCVGSSRCRSYLPSTLFPRRPSRTEMLCRRSCPTYP
jgi:CRP/FNR family cyclic AMP-dependent transcriptional regulator